MVQKSLNHTEIVNLVQQGVQQVLATTQHLTADIMAIMPATCVPALEEFSAPTSTAFINSVTSDIIIQTMQLQMQMMQQTMEMMQMNHNRKKLVHYTQH